MLSLAKVTDELLSEYAFYASFLILEFVFVSFQTGQARLKNKVFANPEDAARHGDKNYFRVGETVERWRRINRNDMENILPFLIVSALYMTTGPSPFWFRQLMRSYTLSRGLYTLVYIRPPSFPARSAIYVIGFYFIMTPMLLVVLYQSI